MTRRLAVLRPEPGNSATAARIVAAGFDAVRLPLFAVEPLAWTAPDPGEYDALLLTSANAVRHAGTALDRLRGVPVVAVGQATANAARAAGLTVAITGDGDAAAVVARARAMRVLHLCGRDRIDAGVDAIPVYVARALPIASAAILSGTVVLLHSVRAAKAIAALARRDLVHDLRIAALSEAVRAAGPDAPGAAADAPSDAALVALAARLAD
ncbi:MAG TPA: uroporphyrinogen-III synthase [Sphingomonas sp.]|nr:uroporphyrinogen-III synthase [Sphingomonas sp.]